MTAATLFATVTFLLGLILLLGWLYVTADNPRSGKILLKSVFLFVLPGVVLAAVPPKFLAFPLAMWVAVLIEECMKVIAAATEQNPTDRFFIVVLFGVWEFLLAKPLWGFSHPSAVDELSTFQLAGLTTGALVTVLMHAVTAEIYAFRFQKRLAIALATSWLLHTSFNESVDLFGISLVSSLIQIMPLLLLFVSLWPKLPHAVNCKIIANKN